MKRIHLTKQQKQRIIIAAILIILFVVIPLLKEHFQPQPLETLPVEQTPGLTLVTDSPQTSPPASTPSSTPATALSVDPKNFSPPFTSELLAEIPEFSGDFYIAVHNNEPYFTDNQMQTISFEYYAPLDDLGRCTWTVACIGKDLMPTEKRGEIGSVKPSGWKNHPYEWVDGRYVYNRCHLIGYQLTAENANERNLITGTRSLNVIGMLPFENLTADYIKATGMHVLYRVTPVYSGDELVCRGILMEGISVEDNGEGIEFCVFCYNVEPGVVIDYATGENWAA